MVDCGCYWVGFVMRDRLFNRECNTAAVKTWQDYQKGNVYLLQKKISTGVWEYWWYRCTPKVGGRHVGSIRNSDRITNRTSALQRA